MPRLTPEDALKKAMQDKADAERRLNEAQSKISKKERADDTRRKIIVGAIVLKDAENKDSAMVKYLTLKLKKMTKMTKRDKDLFADFLEDLPAETNQTPS